MRGRVLESENNMRTEKQCVCSGSWRQADGLQISHDRIVSCGCCCQVRAAALPTQCSLRLRQGIGPTGGVTAESSLVWAHNVAHRLLDPQLCGPHNVCINLHLDEQWKTGVRRLNPRYWRRPIAQHACNADIL